MLPKTKGITSPVQIPLPRKGTETGKIQCFFCIHVTVQIPLPRKGTETGIHHWSSILIQYVQIPLPRKGTETMPLR